MVLYLQFCLLLQLCIPSRSKTPEDHSLDQTVVGLWRKETLKHIFVYTTPANLANIANDVKLCSAMQ